VRLERGEPTIGDLVETYRGGSVPQDGEIPDVEEIRRVLADSRARLIETVSTLNGDDLERVPEPLRERGWTIARVLDVIGWHEPHHQGQAHLTLNLWENR
jgi:uncharacterized damage-inducible protein DinB